MIVTPTRWLALPAILTLSALIGCQGFSSGNSSKQPQNPGQISSSASSVNFGNVAVNTSKIQSITVSNIGGASVVLNQAPITGTGFSVGKLNLPLTLDAGQSASFNVIFTPKTKGAVSGTLSLASDASNSNMSIGLSGTGGDATGQLTVQPEAIDVGNVNVGSSGSVSASLLASGTSITVSSASSSNGRFAISGLSLPVTIAAGQKVNFTVTFSPQVSGAASGTLTFVSDATPSSSSATVSGTGIATAGQLTVSPATLAIGNVVVGNSGSGTATLSASGASVTVTSATSNNARFAISGLTLPVTIAAGQQKSFTVTFSPQAAGAASANLTFASNASAATTTSSVTGTGVAAAGQLTVSPGTLNLGNVPVGTSGSASGTLSATGASVTVTAATSNNSRFSLGGLSLPVTIPAGQQTSFSVTFSPLTTGAASATLTFTSNAAPSTTTSSATGTGTSATSHSVSLDWTASTSSGVIGYNVYRAAFTSSCGSYAKLNSALNSSTSYSDTAVTSGSTYCYVTTAVNSSSEESTFSNVVQATIPTP